MRAIVGSATLFSCLTIGFAQAQTTRSQIPPSPTPLLAGPTQVQAMFTPDASRECIWDTAQQAWTTDSTRYAYRYNAVGQTVRQAGFSYLNNDSTLLTAYAYDVAGRDTAVRQYVRSAGAWAPMSHSVTRYDSQGNIILSIYSQWNAATGQFGLIYGTRYDFIYDSQNRILEQKTYSADMSGAWTPNTWLIFTYPNSAPEYSTLEYRSFDGSGWQPWQIFRQLAWHDYAQGQLNSYRNYFFNPADSSYSNLAAKATYTYDSVTGDWVELLEDTTNGGGYVNRMRTTHTSHGDTTVLIQESWINGDWHYTLRQDNRYEANGTSLYSVLFNWQISDWVIQLGSRSDFIYNALNLPQHVIRYSSTGGPFVKNSRTSYEYTLVASRPSTERIMLSLAPSPAHNRVTIAGPGTLSAVRVLDAAGRAVQVHFEGNQADVSGLRAGLYQIEGLNAKGQRMQSRFVKE